MKPTTRKVTGPALERLFRDVFAADGGVEPAVADRLARRLSLVLSSARARRVPLRSLMDRREVRPDGGSNATAAAPPTQSSEPIVSRDARKFDPFAFGLVPVFQREGRDGLLARLAEVATADHLRAMAKAQHIALDARLRSSDVPPAEVRDGIVAAVEKRIADRRAAAS